MLKTLRQQGATRRELDAFARCGGPSALFRAAREPMLMMRLAAMAQIDPRICVRIAVRATEAVVDYVGDREPRPRYALDAARSFLVGDVSSAACGRAGQLAEEVAQALRARPRPEDDGQRRQERAETFAAFAATRAALAARDAAADRERLREATFPDPEQSQRAAVGCALATGQVLLDAVEAACAATAAAVTRQTGTAIAGQAAAMEARPLALGWAAHIIRDEIPEPELMARLG